ncbi:hypothetical protein DM02DRAFT_733298 [Periconia macrospinosa]|uniref:Uncharacterized protein n=1 Tax=Periconia macrospinosa TaxID=97972 RepID=A0A2V1D6F6_9PLEO|nr:hypothetical protein DM02DRAFT_733298 [Periconia macrospinosa]
MSEKNAECGDGDDRLDPKYNMDRQSWFFEGSEIFKKWNSLLKMKPGGKFERIRWLPYMADLVDDRDHEKIILNHSPKIQTIISLYSNWCLLRDEKNFPASPLDETKENYLEGFIRVTEFDGAEQLTDFKYLYILSREAKGWIKTERREKGKTPPPGLDEEELMPANKTYI